MSFGNNIRTFRTLENLTLKVINMVNNYIINHGQIVKPKLNDVYFKDLSYIGYNLSRCLFGTYNTRVITHAT